MWQVVHALCVVRLYPGEPGVTGGTGPTVLTPPMRFAPPCPFRPEAARYSREVMGYPRFTCYRWALDLPLTPLVFPLAEAPAAWALL